jgi:hypothetical protein
MMTPTIGIPHTDNQLPVARVLSERDALVSCESIGDELWDTTHILIDEPSHRQRILEKVVENVGGEGVWCIEEAIEKHL